MSDIDYYKDKIEHYFSTMNIEVLDYKLYNSFLRETEINKILELESKEDEDAFWEYCIKSESSKNNESFNNNIEKESILKLVSELIIEISNSKGKAEQEKRNLQGEELILNLNFDDQL